MFETERLYLRRINEGDLKSFYNIMGNDNTMKYLGKTLTKTEIEYYIKEISQQHFNENEGEFTVVLKETDEVIGQFSIYIKDRDKRAEIAFMFNDKYWNKGYGYECANYIVNYLLNKLNMNKIVADCDISNKNTCRLLEKLGMKTEGVLKQHRFSKRTKKFYDVVMYSLLSQENKKHHNKN